ncbi:hypothetical protein S7711_05575 [Stachybotrys chartarum IBT 7711]|uniref:RRM domain-containing protein n=1 Tax=Stachybotrys chartarum (strain CBS 109288 / IBT 7711) TaxID=1280523 RepID=A0A084AKB6_STACB|nr:hypothetical protein S7711_05575 [Stachybotrys chartarum IBT 7711]
MFLGQGRDGTGDHQPELSSSPVSSTPDHQGIAMTALEIGVIVGTILAFLLGLFFVFYCRQSEKANASDDETLPQAEEGHIQEPPAVHQHVRRGAYAYGRQDKPGQWFMALLRRDGRTAFPRHWEFWRSRQAAEGFEPIRFFLCPSSLLPRREPWLLTPPSRSATVRAPARRPHGPTIHVPLPAMSATILDPPRALPRLLLDGTADTEAKAEVAAAAAIEAETAGIGARALLRAPKFIVVERLSKNINEDHLYEIFGQFGPIKDLDLPINRTFGTNRGTAYILFDHLSDAEAAIAHMHEAQVDGAVINVSIVLPRRKLSPAPPTARRGANIDPRIPFSAPRGGGPPGPANGGSFASGGGRARHASPSGRHAPRSDVYRPGTRSPSHPLSNVPSNHGDGHRYRSRSRDSHLSRSRSRSPATRRRGGGSRNGDYDEKPRDRSRSYDSFEDRSRSRSPDRGGCGYR